MYVLNWPEFFVAESHALVMGFPEVGGGGGGGRGALWAICEGIGDFALTTLRENVGTLLLAKEVEVGRKLCTCFCLIDEKIARENKKVSVKIHRLFFFLCLK